MASIKDDAINKEDVERFVKENSDFSFEIEVLRELHKLGYKCKHASTYDDPLSGKPREYDIRATKSWKISDKYQANVALAVECKNISANFPILVHCLPRNKSEAFVDVILHTKREHEPGPLSLPHLEKNSVRIRLKGESGPYGISDPVGKSFDQFGKKQGTKNQFYISDAVIFEKLTQSVNSAYDLLVDAHENWGDEDTTNLSVVIPVLVVPDERIWAVCYSWEGNVVEGPYIEGRIPYLIEKNWKVGNLGAEMPVAFNLSHLEIVDKSRLTKFVKEFESIKCLNDESELLQAWLSVMK